MEGLDVGGGTFPGVRGATRTPFPWIGLNIDPDAGPGVVAPAEQIQFPSSCFRRVRFSHYGYDDLALEPLGEAFRVLVPGGILRISTGCDAPMGDILAGLRRVGFECSTAWIDMKFGIHFQAGKAR